MSMRATDVNGNLAEVTHPLDSRAVRVFGPVLHWYKHPFDNYLWEVLVQLKGQWVVWVYNGATDGACEGSYCDTLEKAEAEWQRRCLTRLPSRWLRP